MKTIIFTESENNIIKELFNSNQYNKNQLIKRFKFLTNKDHGYTTIHKQFLKLSTGIKRDLSFESSLNAGKIKKFFLF